MRDPFSWSLPLGRMFGITVRMHVLFPLVAIGLILRSAFDKDAPPGVWLPVTAVMGLLFLSVLLHEFGHCFGARLVDGDAHEVLLWPLGGLASVEMPHTPRAHFVVAAAGPLVNVLLCLGAGAGLTWISIRPPFNPWWIPVTYDPLSGQIGCSGLFAWDGTQLGMQTALGVVFLSRLFYVNWVLFLFNIVLVGFPMDSGRMFQSLLWWRIGYNRATIAAVYAGFLTMLVLGIVAIASKEILLGALALFIYVSCRQQWIILETGGEDSPFGYDFSQGYTSLERGDPPASPRRRPNFFRRWWQNRQRRKMEREQEVREAEERRMDELLEKIQREGRESLTDEERRFLTRVSARYRNRQ
jgi:Zn-dependent protease